MRLIDADELIKFGWEMHRPVVNVIGVKSYEIASLEQAKKVDAVPVVRCKDCRYSYDDTGGLRCSYGVCVDCIVPEDFFCRYGERKGGDE